MTIQISDSILRQIKKNGLLDFVTKHPFSIREIEVVGESLAINGETINEAKQIQKARLNKSFEQIEKLLEGDK